jgi:hypothetical protein
VTAERCSGSGYTREVERLTNHPKFLFMNCVPPVPSPTVPLIGMNVRCDLYG